MSVDSAVYAYFPASGASQALRALQGMLASMPGERRRVKVVAPDGEKIALPTHDDDMETRGNHRLVGGESLEFETLIDPEKGEDEEAMFPVLLGLDLGREFLEVSLSSIETSLAPLLFLPAVRARVAEWLDEGKGLVAVSEGMGEWRTFTRVEDDDKALEVQPDHSRLEVGVDRFAAFLVDRLRSDA